MQSYYKLTLYNLPYEHSDAVSELCFRYGSSGAAEALPYRQPNLAYDPEVLTAKEHDLDFFFAERPSEQLLAELRLRQFRWQLQEEQHKDWLAEWKKGFEPFCLVGPYWVVPSWKASPVDESHTISIDPGMAFGTGTHATTKMISYLLYRYFQNNQAKKVLDVGTGTAILAMLARKLGAGSVTGIEIDPEARRVAKENVLLNKLDGIEILDGELDEVFDEHECVLANIIDGVLLKLKEQLLMNLSATGSLFLAGILLENESEFIEAFLSGTNLQIVERVQDAEWVSYWMRPSLSEPNRS